MVRETANGARAELLFLDATARTTLFLRSQPGSGSLVRRVHAGSNVRVVNHRGNHVELSVAGRRGRVLRSRVQIGNQFLPPAPPPLPPVGVGITGALDNP